MSAARTNFESIPEENEKIVSNKMEIEDLNNSNENPENSFIATLNSKYLLLKKIGKGFTGKVYLGCLISEINNPSKKYYAIKIIKPEKMDTTNETELKNLYTINSPNILKIYEQGSGIIKKKNSKEKNIFFIITDYLSHGELIKYITNISPITGENMGFGEELGRLIFSQLLDGVEILHNNDIVHRDIKLENLMLSGKDYNITIVDFGFAYKKSAGYLKKFLGTPNYAAPELHLNQPYLGVYDDIFSLGVTLFILVTGNLPFRLPIPGDSLYQYIINTDYINFWRKRNIKVSPSFMELFDNLVAFDFTQRPSISEIRKSKWMQEINWNLLPKLKEEYIKREKIIIQKNIKNENNNIMEDSSSDNKFIIEAKKVNNVINFPQNDINQNLIEIDNSLDKIKEKKYMEIKKELKEQVGVNISQDENDSIINNSKDSVKKSSNGFKGFIKLNINISEIKNLNNLFNCLKQFLKNEYFAIAERKPEKLFMKISNGEYDVNLNFIKRKKHVKIVYVIEHGLKDDYMEFKKIIKKFNPKIV